MRQAAFLFLGAMIGCTRPNPALDDTGSTGLEDSTTSENSTGATDPDDDATSASFGSTGTASTGEESTSGASSSGSESGETTDGFRCGSDEDCDPGAICEVGTCNDAAHTVYLNFEAEGDFLLVPDAPASAPDNQHNYGPIGSGQLLEDYGVGPKRESVVQNVRELLAPYRVAIETERPAGTNYSMVVMTERPFDEVPGPGPDENNTIGRGPLDCEDLLARDVSFLFLSEGDAHTPELHARFLVGVILRDTGLSSVADTGHVLHPYLLAGGGAGEIKDECTPIDPDYEVCDGMGTGCATGQNSHAWLEHIWGLRAK